MAQAEKEKLAGVLSEAFTVSCRKLSMLLKHDVSVALGSVDEFDSLSKAANALQEVVVIKTSFANGNFYQVMPANCAAPFAELMMTGEVEGGSEVGELKEKAIGEAFSQIMPDFSSAVSKALGTQYSFSVLSAKFCKDIAAVQEIITESSAIVSVNYQFGVGDVTSGIFQQIIPIDVFNSMIPEAKTQDVVDTELNLAEDFLNMNNNIPDTPDNTVTVQPVQFPSFEGQTSMQMDGSKNFDLLLDIKLNLTVELGRSELPIKKVLELTRGSIIELDKVAGEPVELFANGKIVAKGEVVVIEDNFGLRITSIVSPDDRIKNL